MKINVHQIYFQPSQLGGLDPAFIPYDNSKCPKPDYREFYVFQKEYHESLVLPHEWTGYVSWKFQKKTGISGQEFINYCKANPGYDVYFINPYPLFISLGNVWDSGEKFHQGTWELTEFIFKELNYNIDLKSIPRTLRQTAYCNFWVGNDRFWKAYMDFCLPILDYIENRMPPKMKKRLFTQADKVSKASFFSYIFERLFTTFLFRHPEIRAKSFEYSETQLAHRFSVNEISLIQEILDVERKYLDRVEPLATSKPLQLALHFYNQMVWNNNPFREIVRIFAVKIWHWIPFRQRLQQNAFVLWHLERRYQSLRAESKHSDPVLTPKA